MLRQYEAFGYIGKAYVGENRINFLFKSEHRANSKANLIDAVNTYKRRHGHSNIIIVNVLLRTSDYGELEG